MFVGIRLLLKKLELSKLHLSLSFLKTISEKNLKGINSIIFNRVAIDNPSLKKSKLKFAIQ